MAGGGETLSSSSKSEGTNEVAEAPCLPSLDSLSPEGASTSSELDSTRSITSSTFKARKQSSVAAETSFEISSRCEGSQRLAWERVTLILMRRKGGGGTAFDFGVGSRCRSCQTPGVGVGVLYGSRGSDLKVGLRERRSCRNNPLINRRTGLRKSYGTGETEGRRFDKHTKQRGSAEGAQARQRERHKQEDETTKRRRTILTLRTANEDQHRFGGNRGSEGDDDDDETRGAIPTTRGTRIRRAKDREEEEQKNESWYSSSYSTGLIYRVTNYVRKEKTNQDVIARRSRTFRSDGREESGSSKDEIDEGRK